MIGIDYTTASLSERERLAFTTAQAHEAMKACAALPGINGCVLISTCNRTELWLEAVDGGPSDMQALFCGLKQLNSDDFAACFVQRAGDEAIRHLFEVSCGLKSQIWGEDQILTQIKNAVENARLAGTASEILQKLFQYAVTSAKKIKTDIKWISADASIAAKTMELIGTYFNSPDDIRCLVIGSGEMGRMMASMLAARGIPVMITMRKYKRGFSVVPSGCEAIPYENRNEMIKDCNLIVSATLSPHYTLRVSDLTAIGLDSRPRLLVDLAVPRDIEPGIADLPHIALINTDNLGRVDAGRQNGHILAQTAQIIDKYKQDFRIWLKTREYLPLIDRIAADTSEKIRLNLLKQIDEAIVNEEQKLEFEQKLDEVCAQAVKNILFRMKDNLGNDQWEICFGGWDDERAQKNSSL